MGLIGIFLLLNVIMITRITFEKIGRKRHLKRVIKIKTERYKIMHLSREIKMKIALQKKAEMAVLKDLQVEA